jgi:hypothetical protein
VAQRAGRPNKTPALTADGEPAMAAHASWHDAAKTPLAGCPPAASTPSPCRPNPSNKALPCLSTSFGQEVESDSQFFENLDSIKSRLALVAIIEKK